VPTTTIPETDRVEDMPEGLFGFNKRKLNFAKAVRRTNQRAVRRINSISFIVQISFTTTPIKGINTLPNPVMESRVRPVFHLFRAAMLDRVIVDIIQVRPVIRLVPD
jgi:hypothetical protein